MIPLVVIRPEPGCAASVRAAAALGMDAHGFPLFTIRPVPWAGPSPADHDALLVGSANVFRCGGTGLAAYRHLPVHVVGRATAQAAAEAGFAVAGVGSGGLQPVLDAVPAGTRLLRLAGAERIALTAPHGVTMTEAVAYEAASLTMPEALAGLLRAPAVIALHSAEAARHFGAECDRRAIARGRLALACIGPRVGSAAGHGWASVALAGTPDEAALLACARDLCQNPPGEVRDHG